MEFEWSVSRPGRFACGKEPRCPMNRGDWVCPGGDVDTLEEGKNLLSPAGIRTPRLAIIIIIIIVFVLLQVLSLFQNEFSAKCDLVLPLSISSILCFP